MKQHGGEIRRAMESFEGKRGSNSRSYTGRVNETGWPNFAIVFRRSLEGEKVV